MDGSELEKATPYIVVELIEYETNSVVSKSILKKTTGSVSVMSFENNEGWIERTSPFDTFIQIIDGAVDVVIDGKSTFLTTGDGIIIPAHAPHYILPNVKFKMILTVIKSGYDEWDIERKL